MASTTSGTGVAQQTEVKAKRLPVTATTRMLTRPWAPAASVSHALDATGSRVYAVAAGAVILVGISLRLYVYLLNRPLWLDEAMLALNVATRSYRELLQPLALDQWAPPLFLWLERFAVETAGVSEATLRFVPLLAGIAMVVLSWPVARHFLGDRGGVLAAAIIALPLTLSRYATEVKPYGTDAFVTMMLLGLLVSVLASPASRWRWLFLTLGGLLALTLSHPATFIMAGVVAALVMDSPTRSFRH
jgi:uncharacterized membrane protein